MSSKNFNLKTCTWCKKTKELSEFYYSEKSSGKNHYYPHCIECDNEKNKQDRRSKDGVIFEIYRKQKTQAKNSFTILEYTKNEFYEWLIYHYMEKLSLKHKKFTRYEAICDNIVEKAKAIQELILYGNNFKFTSINQPDYAPQKVA